MTNIRTQIFRPLFRTFAALGFLISLAIFQLLMNWISVLAILYDKPNLGYHELPSIVHLTQGALRWAVWLIPVAIFIIDLPKRDFTKTTGYSIGLALAMVVTFIIFWIRWVEVMSEF